MFLKLEGRFGWLGHLTQAHTNKVLNIRNICSQLPLPWLLVFCLCMAIHLKTNFKNTNCWLYVPMWALWPDFLYKSTVLNIQLIHILKVGQILKTMKQTVSEWWMKTNSSTIFVLVVFSLKPEMQSWLKQKAKNVWADMEWSTLTDLMVLHQIRTERNPRDWMPHTINKYRTCHHRCSSSVSCHRRNTPDRSRCSRSHLGGRVFHCKYRTLQKKVREGECFTCPCRWYQIGRVTGESFLVTWQLSLVVFVNVYRGAYDKRTKRYC